MRGAPNTMLSAAGDAQQSADVTTTAATTLMRRVGNRVSAARKVLGLSRRVLSERSGVSPRYLANLESGDGNISIGLLQKVALALGTPVEHLVMDDDPQTLGLRQVTELYRQADPATRLRALRVLDPQRTKESRAGRLCLVGLRGAGKSTLGALVGREFGAPFIELNRKIEESAGMPVAEIIALYGQEGYRQFEAETLTEIAETTPRAVVAVAGGIVSEESTFSHLLSRFHTVWVRASAGDHMARVRAQGDERPMQGNPQAMIQLRQILKTREAYYAQADHVLDTSGKTAAQSHAELSHLIRVNQILDHSPQADTGLR